MSTFNPEKNYYYKLECPVQNYDWGNNSRNSIIRKFTKAENNENTPMAELWMGAHKIAPSTVITDFFEQSLETFINIYPEHVLGKELFNGGVKSLPFLLKILDIGSPLSIQAHPDKKNAQILHGKDPIHYPDKNHKPEIAISISDMEAMVGFRRPGQIYTFFKQIPELANLCSKSGAIQNNEFPPRPELLSRYDKKNWIKHHFSNLMKSSSSEIEEATNSHLFRLKSLEIDIHREEDNLFLKLIEIFGKKDPGIFCPYFLNYVSLKKGQALYIGPNEPHSYISGQIIECMAASDNVVRAGLTNKFRDLPVLLDMLHYNFGPPQIQNIKSELNVANSFRHFVPDFIVNHYPLGNQEPCIIKDIQRPSIFLVLEGNMQLDFLSDHDDALLQTVELKEGSVFLIPGDLGARNVHLNMKNTGSEICKCYQATVGQSYR